MEEEKPPLRRCYVPQIIYILIPLKTAMDFVHIFLIWQVDLQMSIENLKTEKNLKKIESKQVGETLSIR